MDHMRSHPLRSREFALLLLGSGAALGLVVLGLRAVRDDSATANGARVEGLARTHLVSINAATEATPGARVPADSVPSTTSKPTLGLVDECLRGGGNGVPLFECLMACMPDRVEATQVGSWLCSSGWPIDKKTVVLQVALLHQDPGQCLRFLDSVYAACSGYMETPLIEAALGRIRTDAPLWFDKARQALEPETAFACATEAPIQALHAFAKGGDPYLASMLTYGACGLFGGTAGQMLRSALAAAAVIPGGDAYASMLEGILDSYSIPRANDMGAFLVTFSLQARAWVDGNPERALGCISRALDDPRFRSQAAAQLLRYFDVAPPGGIQESAWSELRRRAQFVVENGL